MAALAFLGFYMRFDIVVPVYNKAHTVLRAVDSVLSQEYEDFSLYVVDDGSSDGGINSLSLLRDSRLTILRQENSGVSVARNTGVSLGHSQYVCFLDADDEWDKGFLQRMALLISDFPEAAMYSTGHRVSEDGVVRDVTSSSVRRGYVSDFYLLSRSIELVNSSKVALRRDVLEEIGGFPSRVKVGEDLYVWIRAAFQKKVAYDPSVAVTIFRTFEESKRERSKLAPFPVEYFSRNRSFFSDSHSLKKYVEFIGLRHVIGSGLSGDFRGGFIRAVALAKINFILGFFSVFFVVLPPFFLRGVKKLAQRRN